MENKTYVEAKELVDCREKPRKLTTKQLRLQEKCYPVYFRRSGLIWHGEIVKVYKQRMPINKKSTDKRRKPKIIGFDVYIY